MKSLRSALVAAVLIAMMTAACRKAEPPAAERPVARPETPGADPAIAEAADDPAWIAGMWKKEGDLSWLLFNLPADVAELAGKPPRVVRRGKLSVHGPFVSAIFSDASLEFEASKDRAQLSGAPGVYRRGSPP